MFGFEIIEIVGGLVGLALLGLLVWKLSDDSDSTTRGRSSDKSKGKSKGKSRRK